MFALIAFIFSFAWAQTPALSTDAATPPSAEEAKEPDGGKTIEWVGAVEYLARTNYADTVSPRLYSHQLVFGYGFQHTPTDLSVYAGLAVAFATLGDHRGEIIGNEYGWDDHLDNLSLGVQKKFNFANRTTAYVALDNDFPTSPEARREQYNSVTTLRSKYSVPLFSNRLSLSATGELIYIWNTYSYSPSTLRMNKQGGLTGTLSANLRLLDDLWFTASAGSQTSQYFDATTDQLYRNSVGLTYTFSRYILMASYSNGSYADRKDASLWFIDEYRRVASLRASVTF